MNHKFTIELTNDGDTWSGQFQHGFLYRSERFTELTREQITKRLLQEITDNMAVIHPERTEKDHPMWK